MFKKSNNPQIESLTKSYRDRAYNLSSIKLPEGLKKCCVWCLEPLTGMQRRWCGKDDCLAAALAWARPQKEQGLYALLVRQDYKCNACQLDWKPYIDMVSHDFQGRLTSDQIFFFMSRFKLKVPAKENPEVDHIVPIYKGGQALGLENHQAICYTCHKTKTSKDLSGKRKK